MVGIGTCVGVVSMPERTFCICQCMCARVCERLPLGVFLRVCQEVDCCGGGVRGCRAPNEGVRNKISALGSSSAHRLPQTPSD